MDEYPNTRDNGVGINYLYTDIDGNLLSGDLEKAKLVLQEVLELREDAQSIVEREN